MAINSCDICGCIPTTVGDAFYNQASLNILCNILTELQGGASDNVNLAKIGGVAVTTQLMGIQVEDTAHVSGDSGVFVLGVRNNAGATLTSTDGDYSPIATNPTGSVYVDLDYNHTAGGNATNILKQEDSAHASGDAGVFVLGVTNENGTVFAGTTVGDYAPIGVDRNGNVNVILTKNIPGATPGNWAVRAEDDPAASGDAGIVNLFRRNDTGAVLQADGDYGVPVITSSGAIAVDMQIANVASLSQGLLKREDDPSGNADGGAAVFSVRKDTPAANADVSANGDYTKVITDNRGAAWTQRAGASFLNIAGAGTNVVKASAGVLHRIIINKAVANSVTTIYDNTSAAGTTVGIITQPAAVLQSQASLEYGVACDTGITVVTSAADDITVVYS